MIGYGISLKPAFDSLSLMALFSSPLAQRAEDAAGTLSDLYGTDPDLQPGKESFEKVDIPTSQAPEYQYAALESPSFIRLLKLWGTEPLRQDSSAERIGYTINGGEDFPKNFWCRIVHRDLSKILRP